MAVALPRLPDHQLEPLKRAYDQAVAAKRRQTLLGGIVLIIVTVIAARTAEVDLARLLTNFGAFFSYFGRMFVFDDGALQGHLVFASVTDWYWGLQNWLLLLLDTILMAYVATLFGSIGAFLLCFLVARNLSPNPWVRGGVKRLMEFCRTVPEIVFAMLFVIAFGLGPTPGVLAIMIHTIGANGKLFTEVVENIDMKPVEGAIATGGGWLQSIRYGVLPQVLSNFASYTLLRFEVNVRSASIMGFVGAGGIGMVLIEAIRKFYYTDVSAMLLLIIATVVLIDYGTQQLRYTLLGREERS